MSRAVWGTDVDKTKTPTSKAKVPVISLLRTLLDEHKKRRVGESPWIFTGEKKGFSLNLDNLTRRVILPKVREQLEGLACLAPGTRHDSVRSRG